MHTPIRQLVRHGAVFGAGAILSRLASILLLPLYTRHLTPSDYGIIAIIDLTINLLSIAAGAGLSAAATREHCRDDNPRRHDVVWWTAAAVAAGMSTVVVLPALMGRHAIAATAFGADITDGATYFGLALLTLWTATVLQPFESYFRAIKASTFLTALSFGLLIVNIALNVTMIVGLGLGVLGILWGNLATTVLRLAIVAGVYVRDRGPFAFDNRLVRTYWSFGWPLVVFGLLSACMHEADRYIVRLFMNLHDVGLYSIAYQIGQGINTLVIMPFTTVWMVMVYEVGQRPDAEQIYARVFRYFVSGLALVMLGASLFADTAIAILAPPEYSPAATLIPIVCLAYLFFSLHEHFKVPALLSGQTTSLIPVVAIAAASNIMLNLVLVPRLGAAGAAWASVLTFIVFSFGGLVQYRRIHRYHYPFAICGLIVAGMFATYLAHRGVVAMTGPGPLTVGVGLLMWTGWAMGLFGKTAAEHLPDVYRALRRQNRSAAIVTPAVVLSTTASGASLPDSANPSDARADGSLARS